MTVPRCEINYHNYINGQNNEYYAKFYDGKARGPGFEWFIEKMHDYYDIHYVLVSMFAKYLKQKNVPLRMCAPIVLRVNIIPNIVEWAINDLNKYEY